jgi:hypothetical protein
MCAASPRNLDEGGFHSRPRCIPRTFGDLRHRAVRVAECSVSSLHHDQ